MNVPEGVQTIHAEGRDLRSAITGAAEQLGLHPAQVDYKLDMSHFRTQTGVSVARTTVRIIAWGSDRPVPSGEGERRSQVPAREARPRAVEPSAEAPSDGNGAGRREERPRRERSDAREGGERDGRRRRRRRDRGEGEGQGDQALEPREPREPREPGERRERPARSDKPENLRGPEEGATDASAFAQQWFSELMQHMGVVGEVTGTGSATRVHLAVKAERAGRIVGKRGATLGSIRHLLGLALEKNFGPIEDLDVDVGDDRPREERAPREDRGERRGRGRGGDRDGAERGRYPEEKLRALARRAAEKAVETGQTITVNLELNSFDRRIVHLEVSEIDGVESQSEERMGSDGRMVKYVQIIPIKG